MTKIVNKNKIFYLNGERVLQQKSMSNGKAIVIDIKRIVNKSSWRL